VLSVQDTEFQSREGCRKRQPLDIRFGDASFRYEPGQPEAVLGIGRSTASPERAVTLGSYKLNGGFFSRLSARRI
jgi:hypothetical protein